MTNTERKWAARVEEWRASGETAAEFVVGRGFQASRLRYWISRLRPATEGVAAPAGRPLPVRMVRVVPKPPVQAPSSLVVAVGATHVMVRTGFDPVLLREVVDALGASQ